MFDVTEAKTRQNVIDNRLAKVGWNIDGHTLVTSELDIWIRLPEGIEEPEHEYQVRS